MELLFPRGCGLSPRDVVQCEPRALSGATDLTPWERSPACPLFHPHLAGVLSGLSMWPGARRCSEEGTSDLRGVAPLLP